METHLVELFVHGRWVGPLLRVKIQRTHFCPVEPVDHEDVGGIVPVAVPFGHVEHFLLALVALFALDESEGGFRR